MQFSATTDDYASAYHRAEQLLGSRRALQASELHELEDLFKEMSTDEYLALESDPANSRNLKGYDRWRRRQSFPVLFFFGLLFLISVVMGLLLV